MVDKKHILFKENVVDNVTSTDTDKPLSANQGKVLKALIDAIPSATGTPVSGDSMVYYNNKWNLVHDYAFDRVNPLITCDVTATGQPTWDELGTTTDTGISPGMTGHYTAVIQGMGSLTMSYEIVKDPSNPGILYIANIDDSGNIVLSMAHPIAIKIDTSTKMIYLTAIMAATASIDISYTENTSQFTTRYIPNLPISKITNLQSELDKKIGSDDGPSAGNCPVYHDFKWNYEQGYGYISYEDAYKGDIVVDTASAIGSIVWSTAQYTSEANFQKNSKALCNGKSADASVDFARMYDVKEIAGDTDYLYIGEFDISGNITFSTYNPFAARIHKTTGKLQFACTTATTININLQSGWITKMWEGYLPEQSSSAAWGSITGTLSNQTDLQTALNAKLTTPSGTLKNGTAIVYYNGAWHLVNDYAYKDVTQLANTNGTISAESETGSITWAEVGTYTGTPVAGNTGVIVVTESGNEAERRSYEIYSDGTDFFISLSDHGEPVVTWDDPVAIKLEASSNKVYAAMRYTGTFGFNVSMINSSTQFDELFIPAIPMEKVDGLESELQKYLSVQPTEHGQALISTPSGWTPIPRYGYAEYSTRADGDVTTTTPSSESDLHWESTGMTLSSPVAYGDLVMLSIDTSSSTAVKSFLVTKKTGDTNYLYLCELGYEERPQLSYNWPIAVRVKIADNTVEAVNQEAETWTLTIEGVNAVHKIWKGYLPETDTTWGNITGTLSNQTDLQNALNRKFELPSGTPLDFSSLIYYGGNWNYVEGYAFRAWQDVIFETGFNITTPSSTGSVTWTSVSDADLYPTVGNVCRLVIDGDDYSQVADYVAFEDIDDPRYIIIGAKDEDTGKVAINSADPVAVRISTEDLTFDMACYSAMSGKVLSKEHYYTMQFDGEYIPAIPQSKVEGLSTALAGKEPTIATKNTAFNVNFETTATNIKMNGTQAVGSLSTVARADHVHPSDTAKQNQHSTATATLTVAGWSSKTQTVSVTGVTASNTVFVSPDSSSATDYGTAKILCTVQGSGTLTFTCESVPTSAITVNVVILP